jgi:hypothetical protein
MAAKKRLKSSSKGGQSLKARAKESKGKRKSELNRISDTDVANFKKAPLYIQQRIKEAYEKEKKKKTRVKNKGRYI